MAEVLIGYLVIVSSIIYYLLLYLVYLLRAFERDTAELILATIFSFLLVLSLLYGYRTSLTEWRFDA